MATIGELAKQHAPAALTTLAAIASNGESDSARVSAANAILDRAYGRPPQAHQHSGAVGTYDLSKISDADLKRLEAILGPAVTGTDTGGDKAA